MEENKEGIKICIEANENENMTTLNLLESVKVVLRGKHTNRSLPQETREISNKQPNFIPKAVRKRRKEESQS